MIPVKKYLSLFQLIFIIIQVSVIAQDSTSFKDKIVHYQTHGNFSAVDVIENYLDAIGGRATFENIKDRTTKMHGTLAGKELTVVIKQKVPNKLRQDIQSGQLIQTTIYDGSKGISIVGDQRFNVAGDQLDKLKIEAQMNFILNPEAYGISTELLGEETVDSTECYNIEFKSSAGEKWHQYYSKNSGLKIKETRELKTEDGVILQETKFSNYQEVGGLKFPFSLKQSVGIQTMEMIIDSIAINTGLVDSLFVIPE